MAVPLGVFDFSVSAASCKEGYYTYEVIDGEATITKIDSSINGEITIPHTLGGYSVTCIDDYAFKYCSNITGIIIPESVTTIGGFYNCPNLTAINVAEGNMRYFSQDGVLFSNGDGTNVITLSSYPAGKSNAKYIVPEFVNELGWYAFKDCETLSEIILPDSLWYINTLAFNDCESLTNLTIPKNVCSINSDAFNGCSSLTDINVDQSNDYYYSLDGVLFSKETNTLVRYPIGASRTEYEIPDGTKGIEYAAFSGCDYLENIIIPDSVKSIGETAFSGCDNLLGIIVPAGVTTIENSTFESCINLVNITLPDTITSIGICAFQNCSSLTSINIPDNVTNIGVGILSNCFSLAEINVGTNNKYYCSIDGVLFDKDVKTLILYPTAKDEIVYQIPAGVTSISDDAFTYYHSVLQGIYVPESVTNFGWSATDDFIIYCNVNSYARTYANEHNRPFIAFSVVNNEATITQSSGINNKITLPDKLGAYCVTNIGYGAFRNNTWLTSIDIPDSVVSIDNYVFSGCSHLESINFGNGVKTIGIGVFSDCINLKNVTIPKSVVSIADNAFVNCFGLEEIEVDIDNEYYHSIDGVLFDKNVTNLIKYPAKKKDISYTVLDTVERIVANAFYECEFLENITISKSIVQIESSALSTQNLRQINVVDDNSSFCDINGVLFDKNATTLLKYPAGNSSSLYEIPYGVKNIGPYAFEWCTNQTSIVIPNSVTTVSEGAFFVCKELTSIIIPNSVTSIGDYAFYYCTSLASVSVPNSVTHLGDQAFAYTAYYDDNSSWEANALYIGKHLIKVQNTVSGDFIIKDGTISINSDAFSDCTQLKNVTMPNSITRIGSSVFSYCSSLESITIPEGVTSIEYGTFMNCSSLTNATIPKSVTSIGSSAFSYCSSLESITIPEGVTSIGSQAFMNCSSLTSVTIPKSVLEIGMSAFRSCTNLKNTNIPKNITSIGTQVFMDCSSLTSIIIPYGVSEIGINAFWRCTSLENINIPKSVTNIGNNAFYSCNKLTNVYYAGDENDAKLISIGTSNRNLTNATWHYDSCFNSTSHIYNNDWIVVMLPTCINDGTKYIECSICGDIIVENISKTDTHNWGKWTEELNGNYLRECNDCDAFETITIKEDKPINTTPTDNASNTTLDNSNIELIEKVLTDEEQSKVANGAEVSVYLVVTDISKCVSEEDKNQIETTTPNSEVGMFLDINLFKSIDTIETQVTETNSTVTVSIVIPDELINTDLSIKRTYTIVRIHNSVSETIEGVFNSENNTFSFETDKFSTYALIYEDEQTLILGDANNDGVLNGRDAALLIQYINNWNVTIDLDASDINNDGKVNAKDYVYLLRKINGWENY